MKPEIETRQFESGKTGGDAGGAAEHSDPLTHDPASGDVRPSDAQLHRLRMVFLGPNGLRAGWSIAIFFIIFYSVLTFLDTLFVALGPIEPRDGFAGSSALFIELAALGATLSGMAIVAALKRGSVWDYNLRGPKPMRRFASGAVAGMAVLSLLVGSLEWGGWLRFGTAASLESVIGYAVLWGAVFLMVGCVEEGTMRCFLLSTLERGVNLWWALAAAAAMCAWLVADNGRHGVWGVYAIAIAGTMPCAALHAARARSAGFWQAAWVSSMFFAFEHTDNRGETWVGILAAGAIGFVFCVSVKVTGSAWWAIGCHAAWDWAETFIYGTPDSGLPAKGHWLTTRPMGATLWSGGTDGPEGSVLVLGAILLLLAWLLVRYGRAERPPLETPTLERAAG